MKKSKYDPTFVVDGYTWKVFKGLSGALIGCSEELTLVVQGETIDEVKEAAKEAVMLYFEDLKDP